MTPTKWPVVSSGWSNNASKTRTVGDVVKIGLNTGIKDGVSLGDKGLGLWGDVDFRAVGSYRSNECGVAD